jgi:mono/diheme cytochrome c family protein
MTLLRLNRLAAGAWIGSLTVAAIAFPLVLGLPSVVGIGLWLVASSIAFFSYRMFTGSRGQWDQALSGSRVALAALTGVLITALAIQAIPFGWDRSNPPVTAEPDWDSPRTRELAVRACFDCHSNEVDYAWYARVAPMSWAVQLHVSGARDAVNYSEWDRPQDEADESAETVRDGEMPPPYYLLAHPEARLSDSEIDDLVTGLEATFGSEDQDRD